MIYNGKIHKAEILIRITTDKGTTNSTSDILKTINVLNGELSEEDAIAVAGIGAVDDMLLALECQNTDSPEGAKSC